MDSKVAKDVSLENEAEWPVAITSSPLVHATKDRPKRAARKPSSRPQSGTEADGPQDSGRSNSTRVEEVNEQEVSALQVQKSSVSAVHSPSKEKAPESFRERLKMVRKTRDSKRVGANGLDTPETSKSQLSALDISVTSPSVVASSTIATSDNLSTAVDTTAVVPGTATPPTTIVPPSAATSPLTTANAPSPVSHDATTTLAFPIAPDLPSASLPTTGVLPTTTPNATLSSSTGYSSPSPDHNEQKTPVLNTAPITTPSVQEASIAKQDAIIPSANSLALNIGLLSLEEQTLSTTDGDNGIGELNADLTYENLEDDEDDETPPLPSTLPPNLPSSPPPDIPVDESLGGTPYDNMNTVSATFFPGTTEFSVPDTIDTVDATPTSDDYLRQTASTDDIIADEYPTDIARYRHSIMSVTISQDVAFKSNLKRWGAMNLADSSTDSLIDPLQPYIPKMHSTADTPYRPQSATSFSHMSTGGLDSIIDTPEQEDSPMVPHIQERLASGNASEADFKFIPVSQTTSKWHGISTPQDRTPDIGDLEEATEDEATTNAKEVIFTPPPLPPQVDSAQPIKLPHAKSLQDAILESPLYIKQRQRLYDVDPDSDESEGNLHHLQDLPNSMSSLFDAVVSDLPALVDDREEEEEIIPDIEEVDFLATGDYRDIGPPPPIAPPPTEPPSTVAPPTIPPPIVAPPTMSPPPTIPSSTVLIPLSTVAPPTEPPPTVPPPTEPPPTVPPPTEPSTHCASTRCDSTHCSSTHCASTY